MERENKWIKFYPSLELPKERVSIAYDTHDERGYRFAYGYFQFYNGTCGCFWKDGNEQPKVVKAEDIKYWMLIPSLDVQEDPASDFTKALAECIHQAQCAVLNPMAHAEIWKEELLELAKGKMPISEDLEQAIDTYLATYFGGEKEKQDWPFLKKMAIHFANWQKEQMMAKAVDGTFSTGEYEDGTPIDAIFNFDKVVGNKYEEGEKVKLIIIKK